MNRFSASVRSRRWISVGLFRNRLIETVSPEMVGVTGG